MWNRENIEAQWAGWADRVERAMSVVRPYRARIALCLAVVGPGLIVSNGDNDAGGIYTYAQSGAKYGNTLLPSLIPIALVLYVSLEMCSRMGAVTGKGLSDLIREEFGFRVTFFLMAVVLVVNLGNVMTDSTIILWATQKPLGISRFISIPLSAAAVWALVVAGSAKWVERIFLTFCSIYLAYVVSAFLAKPEWLIALLHLLPPQLMHYSPTVRHSVQVPPFSASYAIILAALVGTTIAPWQHFYLQAAVVEKRVGQRQYATTRKDVLVGSVSCMVIVFFILVCPASTLYVHGIPDGYRAGTAG